MKIILINPPYLFFKDDNKHASPPLGLAYIAAVLEKNDHIPKIIDAVIADFDTESKLSNGASIYGMPINQIVKKIKEYQPDIIGISCMFSTLHNVVTELSMKIKEQLPKTPIVLGGTHATVMADELIRERYIDYIIRGEGDYAFLQLVEHLFGEREIESVSNLTWYSGSEVHSNQQEFIQNIDALPLPARHLLDIEAYIRIGHMQGLSKKGVRATTLITSRGCPGRCIFCSIHSVWGRKFRSHSPERVLDELQELRDKYKIDHLLFEDDNLTFNKKRAEAIFRGMIDRKYSFTWSTPNGVALWTLNYDLLKIIRTSGCHRLTLGVESGDSYTLNKIIRKPLKFEKIEEVVGACKKLRIKTTAFFVIGLPGETMESMRRSMKYAENLDVDSLCISIATPYPGTELYEICKKNDYLVKTFDYSKLMTQIGQIQTPEFVPENVLCLLNKTLVKHGLKHPRGLLFRVIEKIIVSPRETFSFIVKRTFSAITSR